MQIRYEKTGRTHTQFVTYTIHVVAQKRTIKKRNAHRAQFIAPTKSDVNDERNNKKKPLGTSEHITKFSMRQKYERVTITLTMYGFMSCTNLSET